MIKKILLLLPILIITSCYSIKHATQDDYILKSNKININHADQARIKNITKKEINLIIKQQPNKKIIGFLPFHLCLYNISNPKKNNWFNSYLRKIGEHPVLFDNSLTEKSINQIKSYLENNGYFTASINNELQYKGNKVNVFYNIHTGDSYTINNVKYNTIFDSEIYSLIQKKHQKYIIQKGDIFTYNKVNHERIEIEKLLQNNGYYKFSKELIYVEADSTDNKKINLNFRLKEINIDSSSYEKFYIDNIFIHLNSANTNNDTIIKDDYFFIIPKNTKSEIKLNTICELIDIKKNKKYSKEEIEKTYSNLSNLLFFKKIVIEFNEKQNNKLHCNIQLKSPVKMYYSVEAETKRSADEGNLGVSGYLQFGNRNLLKGAENLNGKIKLSLENRQSTINKNEKLFNTREIFYEMSLRVPKLILPKMIVDKLTSSYQMNTNFVFSLAQRQRPDFSSEIITQKLGYNWKSSKNIEHQLNLIELSFSDIGEINSFIENELIENPYLSEQFEDKFIPATNYIFSFNNQKIYKPINHTYIKAKAELSGNLLTAIAPIVNFKKNEKNQYIIFNNSFSQYARMDLDIRRYIILNKENVLVLRGFYGLGYSYGNSEELPIQKQFFSGGVNSIRAWEAFGLGPGSSTDLNNYSTGDIKLEFNIEYRFPLYNSLKSAVFIDGGNIWSIKNDPREGSRFYFNSFPNQIAIGIGVGFRYDFDFFVIRLDVATPVRDPMLMINDRWIENPLNGNFRYNLAIGYPF